MSSIINVSVTGLQSSSIPCVYRTVVLKSNIDFATQVVQENAKYVIKWKYDLEGNTIHMPSGCILDFDGGQLKNGKIVWNNTKVLNLYQYTILDNVTESGTKIEL